MSASLRPPTQDEDPSDQRLRSHLLPPDHVPPKPAERYDLVVLGGGPGGLVAAHGAAGLGARVALVEAALLGGDCLNHGCVPSKALLSTSKEPGIGAAAFRRARKARADIAPHDGVARLVSAGVHVFLGHGRFVSPGAISVDGAILRFRRAVVATGAEAIRPPIPGVEHASVVSIQEVWGWRSVPDRVAVLGAGPVGSELALALARLGATVSLYDLADRPLPGEDPDASAILRRALVAAGVELRLGVRVTSIVHSPSGSRVGVVGESAGERAVDRVVLALGRQPRVGDLGLDSAGVAWSARGIVVNRWLQTSQRGIYAVGDVIGGGFTHVADAQARVVIQNTLVARTAHWSGEATPRCTFTSPEVAHVGPSHEALTTRLGVTPYTVRWDELDRGVTEGAPEGFVRAWVDVRGRLVAATVVGEGAGDLLAPASLMVARRIPAEAWATVMVAYPTRSEAWKRIGDAVRRRRFTPWVAWLLARWNHLRRWWERARAGA